MAVAPSGEVPKLAEARSKTSLNRSFAHQDADRVEGEAPAKGAVVDAAFFGDRQQTGRQCHRVGATVEADRSL